jgi:hypothetical protein
MTDAENEGHKDNFVWGEDVTLDKGHVIYNVRKNLGFGGTSKRVLAALKHVM